MLFLAKLFSLRMALGLIALGGVASVHANSSSASTQPAKNNNEKSGGSRPAELVKPSDVPKYPFPQRVAFDQQRKANDLESKDFDAYLTDRLQIIQVIGRNPQEPFYGLSAIRNTHNNTFYVGIFDNAEGVKSVSKYVLRLNPNNAAAESIAIQFWRNNLPLYQFGTDVSDKVKANSAASEALTAVNGPNHEISLLKLALLVKGKRKEFLDLLAVKSFSQLLYTFPSDSATNGRKFHESCSKYIEGKDINDHGIFNGPGFVINKTDGSATVGVYSDGVCLYSHVFSLSENHKYYKKDLCSGPASAQTLNMLSNYALELMGKGGEPTFLLTPYAYTEDKIKLCRMILDEMNTGGTSFSFDFIGLRCNGEKELGVANGLCVCKNSNTGVISAGIYVMGHRADPMISIDKQRRWSFKNIEKPEQYRDTKLKELAGKYDTESTFMTELKKWAASLISG